MEQFKSQFLNPCPGVVGRLVEMNSRDYPGAAYDPARRQGYRARVVDAGYSSFGGITYVLEGGIGFNSQDFSDFRFVDE